MASVEADIMRRFRASLARADLDRLLPVAVLVLNDVIATLRKIAPNTGVEMAAAVAQELARRLAAPTGHA